MRFEEALEGWSQGRLTQAEAALLLGQCEHSFRRHIERYKADGLDGLLDRRLSQISTRRASGTEVDQVVQPDKGGFASWSVAHFHSKYKADCPFELGVQSRDEVTRISFEYSRVFLPGINNDLVRRFPFQGLKMFGKVEAANEGQHMCPKAPKVGVMKCLDGGFLDGPVHALGLPVRLGVVGLG